MCLVSRNLLVNTILHIRVVSDVVLNFGSCLQVHDSKAVMPFFHVNRIHEFLKLENEIGSITRQEAVSMVSSCTDMIFYDFSLS